ncbi:MAG: hypothetical protein QOF61_780 [Acidobacteriota bacterium]|jgi:hypothetical protein|nr:hypothetical protein [Acidobacteriota bacterium]
METSRYRREYAAYRSACEVARYESGAGASSEAQVDRIRERYAELWTRDAVMELARARDETPATFETERAALSALANAARLAYAEAHAREVTDELSRCEIASCVAWGGERLGLRGIAARLAAESDAARRRELGARWLDAVRPCDDLRAARLERLRDAARELDFDSYGALLAAATNTDTVKLSASARVVLERTAAVYESLVAAWAARHVPLDIGRGLDFADEAFFARLTHLDQFFPPGAARTTYEAAMRGLGVRIGLQENLRVEESAEVEAGGARCFGVRPPEDVRLVFNARAGADFYQNFFDEAARAQQLAWASRELAARYPEFVHAPDRATCTGFGFLFRALFADAAWLVETRGVRASDAEEIAKACALVELHDARRASARVIDQFELYAADDPRAEGLAESFAARRHEATGFRPSPALHLFETTGNGAPAAEALRGRLFAASLGEHLRTRHGTRWWARRAGGDELIDLWNTASRYTVEELAPLAGAGALDAELLSETLNAATKKGK